VITRQISAEQTEGVLVGVVLPRCTRIGETVAGARWHAAAADSIAASLRRPRCAGLRWKERRVRKDPRRNAASSSATLGPVLLSKRSASARTYLDTSTKHVVRDISLKVIETGISIESAPCVGLRHDKTLPKGEGVQDHGRLLLACSHACFGLRVRHCTAKQLHHVRFPHHGRG